MTSLLGEFGDDSLGSSSALLQGGEFFGIHEVE